MAEQVEVQQVPIDQATYQEYKQARTKGETTIEKPVEEVEEPEELEASEDKPEEDKPKSKGGFQRRIDKLTAQKHRLETENAEVTAKNSELTSRIEAIEKRLGGETLQVQKKADESKPTPEKFAADGKTYEEFLEAQTRWILKQEKEATKREQDDAAQQKNTQAAKDAYNERAKASREKHADFDDVLKEADFAIPKVAEDAIIDDENGAEITYYLAKHPEECEKMMAMPTIGKVISYIGFLSAKCAPQEGTVVAEKKVSNAPAPPARVPGGTAVTMKTLSDTENFQEYKSLRKKGITH